jgi:hypothetical protein
MTVPVRLAVRDSPGGNYDNGKRDDDRSQPC